MPMLDMALQLLCKVDGSPHENLRHVFLDSDLPVYRTMLVQGFSGTAIPNLSSFLKESSSFKFLLSAILLTPGGQGNVKSSSSTADGHMKGPRFRPQHAEQRQGSPIVKRFELHPLEVLVHKGFIHSPHGPWSKLLICTLSSTTMQILEAPLGPKRAR